MKKMLISEDEKSRILNLHQNLGYKTSLNEQSVPQQPQANVQKPVESLGNYFTSDPIGKKIASISPTFAKWSNDNKIQTSRAKYQVASNNIQLTAVGTDGQTYFISLPAFELSKGNIPQDSKEKIVEAREAIKQKIAELNAKGAESLKCFNLADLSKTEVTGRPNLNCKTYYDEYDKVVKSTNLDYYNKMYEILKFASVAPKFQPKQG
jgi:hypothetical protein